MPKDKCKKCNWDWSNLKGAEELYEEKQKGHCYMFREKMDRCGQFCPIE